MKIILVAPFIALCASLPSLAHPARQRNGIAGALYFIDNNPAGNKVVASTFGANGQPKFRKAFKTGGKGGIGVDDKGAPVATDVLFTQGALTVGGNKLFAVNAGDNTVSMFRIDKKDPAKLKLMGKPAPTGGDFPVSVTFSKKLSMACVLNGGAASGVRCFSTAKNCLTPIAGSDRAINLGQSTPPAGPANTMSHIQFDESSSHLRVSRKGVPPATKGNVASFAIDAKGKLAAEPIVSEPEGGLLPFGMALVPGTNSALVTDAGVGVVLFNFGNGTAPATSIPTPIDGQKAICWAARSPGTKNFYVSDFGAGNVHELSVAENVAPKLVSSANMGNGSQLVDLAVAPGTADGDTLFINDPGTRTIKMFKLAGPGKMVSLPEFKVNKHVALTDAMMGMVVQMKV